MVSPEEAFQKLSEWKESETALKVSLFKNGKIPVTAIGWIIAFDEASRQVSFSEFEKRSLLVIDFSGALYRIGKLVLEARQPTGEWIIREELRGFPHIVHAA